MSPIGRPMTWRPSWSSSTSMRTSVAFDALEHAAKPLAARDQLLHLDLGLVARPMPRSRTAAPAACRCRARTPRACTDPEWDRARRARGESRREISAHSSTVIVPSGRSAMICTVVPLRPDNDHPHQAKAEIREHRLGDGCNLGGQAGLANEARVGRCAAHRSQSCQVRVSRSREARAIAQNKRADPKGPLSELR